MLIITPVGHGRGTITDLPLLRTTLAVRQKSRPPSFWEVVNLFALLAYKVQQLQEPLCNDY